MDMDTLLSKLGPAPQDAIARLYWLQTGQDELLAELDAAFQSAYFDARLTDRLDAAIAVHAHSRKRILRFTRNENESRGRQVRWQDGADSTSSAYTG